MKLAKIIKLIISIVICQLAGVIGSLVTRPAIDRWYDTLSKPFLLR
jgi:tryptophan-rich sensory protein